MNTQVQTQNQLIKVEEFTSILQTAPDMLSTNQQSVSRCNNAGQGLLDTIEANGEINSDELDAKIADFISKAKITVKKMNERRSPLTQLLTRISKEFTTLETEINPTNSNSITAKLQVHRNRYAEIKLAEIKKKEDVARLLREKENEKKEYREDLSLSLEKHYSNYLSIESAQIYKLFNELSLSNFEVNAQQIDDFSNEYPAREHFSKFKDSFFSVHLSNEDKAEIKKQVVPNLMSTCINRYSGSIQDIKEELLLKLPSRKRELQQIEELRKNDAEAAKRAEAVAQQRKLDEEKQREIDRAKKEEEDRLKAQAKAAEDELLNSFNNTADLVPTSSPDAKVTKKIKVNNVKGFLEIYQMWFLSDGMEMTIPELEKIHKRMITLCEKRANKNGELLTSAFVEYIDDVKAK